MAMNAPGSDADATVVRSPRGFDAARALGHVHRLSQPRRVGTPQERRTARAVRDGFAALGLDARRERFPVPFEAHEAGRRLALAAGVVLALAGAGLGSSRPLAAAVCWALVGLSINAPWRLMRGLAGRSPSRLWSENLVASLPGDAAETAPARVVFMAHYDSKSQVLPTGVRVGLVIAATALCGVLAVGGLAAAAGLIVPGRGAVGVAMEAVVVLILGTLAANVTGNRSPGALDNGSGLGTLLELARSWRPEAEAPVEVHWVATGSEELGLDGARDFLRRHESWWREKPTLLVNLDSVGAGDRLFLAGEPGALRLAEATAEGLGLPWARLRVLGAGMDHEPFAARGLAALSILGDVVGQSLALHSARDRIERVAPEALARAGRLAGAIARTWAEAHRPAFWGAAAEPVPAVTGA